jgi:hypothetical protein
VGISPPVREATNYFWGGRGFPCDARRADAAISSSACLYLFRTERNPKLKILPVADAPKFVKDIDPGVIFYLSYKAEKCLVWKGMEVGTDYAHLVFSTPFKNIPAFELVDAAPFGDEIGIPFTDATLLPDAATMESVRASAARIGTLLVSPDDACLVVRHQQHQPFLLSLDNGQLIKMNSDAEAWVSYPAWEIVRPVDPKAAEKRYSILNFSSVA